MASETAAVSEPALAVLTKTSKGCWPPFSLIGDKGLAQRGLDADGVTDQPARAGFLLVVPDGQLLHFRLGGRGGSGLDATSPFCRAVALVSSTTFWREPVT